MASGGNVTISFAGDTSAVESAVKQVEKMLSQVESQTKQTASNMESSTSKAASSVKDSASKATDAISTLSATIKINGDSVGFENAGETCQKVLDNLKSGASTCFDAIQSAGDMAMSAIKTAATVASGAIAGLLTSSVSLASDLTEVQNVVDVTFGDDASTIYEWAEAAGEAFGLSQLQAEQFSGTMGAILKSMDIDDSDLTQMSTDLVGLAGDMASFYNIDAETAFEKLRSGISGETEPLKQLGINLSETNLEAFALAQGIEESYSSMDSAEKATLRYQYIMSQTADAQGDFSRTMADSLANQGRVIKLNFSELSASIGEVLLPTVQEYAGMISGYAKDLQDAFDKDGFEGLISEGGAIVGELVDEIAKQAPTLINYGFDLIDKIVEGITENMPSISQAALDIITQLGDSVKATMESLKPLIGDIANIFVQGVIEYKDVYYTAAFDMITAIADGIAENAGEIGTGISELIQSMIAKIGEAIPDFIDSATTILVTVLTTLTKDMSKYAKNFSDMISKICDSLAKNLPQIIKAAAEFVKAFVKGIVDNADDILDSVGDVVDSVIDVIEDSSPIIQTFATLFAGAFVIKGVGTIVSNIGKIGTAIGNLVSGFSGNPVAIIAGIAGAITAVVTAIELFTESDDEKVEAAVEDFKSQWSDLAAEVDEAAEAYDDMVEARDKAVSDTTGEWDYYESLYQELQKITDENGKIQGGYEARAEYITTTLAEACGIEIDIVDGVIQKYDELSESIESAMTLQEGQSMLDAYEDSYTEAVSGLTDAAAEYARAQNAYDDASEEYQEKRDAYEAALKKKAQEMYKYDTEHLGAPVYATLQDYIDSLRTGENSFGWSYGGMSSSAYNDYLKGLKSALDYDEDSLKSVLEKAQEKYFGYKQTIEDYSNLQAAVLEEDEEKVEYYTENISNHLLTASNATEEQLKAQVEDYDPQKEGLRRLVEAGYGGVAKERGDRQIEMRDRAKEQLDIYYQEYDTTYTDIANKAEETATSVEESGEKIASALDTSKNAIAEYAASLEQKLADSEIGQMLWQGISDGLEGSQIEDDTEEYTYRTKKAFGINSPSRVMRDEVGKYLGEGILESETEALEKVMPDVTTSLLSPTTILAAQSSVRATASEAASRIVSTSQTSNSYYMGGDGYVQECIVSFERGTNDLVDYLYPKLQTKASKLGSKAVSRCG